MEEAAACDDCIEGWLALTPAFAETIPADGVLAFRYDGYGELDALTLTVRGEDEALVDGSAELSEGPLVWRPAAPLTVGERYTFALLASNLYGSCGVDEIAEIELAGEVTATEPVRPQPRWDAIEVNHRVDVHLSRDVEDVVCCEGDAPELTGCGYYLGESCTSLHGEGFLHTDFRIDPAAWPEAQGQLYYAPFGSTYDEAEVVAYDADDPFPCAVLTATDLATGEVHKGPTRCPDPALEDDLGERSLDPRESLPCEQLQVCEIDEAYGGWDYTDCRRWRGDGCGCAANERGGAASLGLFVLLAALRRRRRPRSPSAHAHLPPFALGRRRRTRR